VGTDYNSIPAIWKITNGVTGPDPGYTGFMDNGVTGFVDIQFYYDGLTGLTGFINEKPVFNWTVPKTGYITKLSGVTGTIYDVFYFPVGIQGSTGDTGYTNFAVGLTGTITSNYTDFPKLLFNSNDGYTMTQNSDKSVTVGLGTPSWDIFNLIGTPPAVTLNSNYTTTSNNIYITWDYPEQFQVGFLNGYLPLINKINIVITIQYSNSGTPTTYTTTLNIPENQSIKYQTASPIPSTTFITGISLTNISPSKYDNITLDGTTRYTYFFYNDNFKYIIDNKSINKVAVWYSNYNSGTDNKRETTFNIFIQAGVPSAPQSINYSGNQYTSPSMRLTTTLGPPQYPDASNTSSLATIQSYKLLYSTNGDSTYRYGGPVSSPTNTIIQSSNIFNLTGLLPDSNYGFTGSAQNNTSNTNYGAIINGSTGTTYLPEPLNNFNINTIITNTWGSSYTANSVNSNGSTGPIYFTIPPNLNIGITGPIHCIDTRGKTTNTTNTLLNQSLVYTENLTTNSLSLSFEGFGQSNPSSESNSFFNFDGSNSIVRDYYITSSINGYTGYYLTVNTPLTIPTSTNVFNNSGLNKKLDLTQTRLKTNGLNNDVNNSSYSFFTDIYSSTPSFYSSAISLLGSTFMNISGVAVCGTIINLNIITNVQNIGKYFYNKTQILKYSAGTTTTNETDTNNVTGGIATDGNSIKYFNGTVTFNRNIGYQNTIYSNIINVSTNAYKPNTDLNYGTTGSNSLNIIYDKPSVNFITNNATYPTSIPSVGTNFIVGYRISSQTSTTIGTSTLVGDLPNTEKTVYDNSTSIVNNSELQLFNGLYGAKNVTNGYLNYQSFIYNVSGVGLAGPDYSGLTGDRGMTNLSPGVPVQYRFVTFVWNCEPNINAYTKIAFNINNVSNISDYNTYSPYIGTSAQQIYLYYRISDDNSTYNTTWFEINNNTVNENLTSGNKNDTSKILGTKNSDATNTFNSNIYTVYGLIPETPVSDSNIYIYLRLAIPFYTTFNFGSVQAKIYSS
jgi:hypothetical protein